MITAQSGIDTEEKMTESFIVLHFPVIRTLWEELYLYIYTWFLCPRTACWLSAVHSGNFINFIKIIKKCISYCHINTSVCNVKTCLD